MPWPLIYFFLITENCVGEQSPKAHRAFFILLNSVLPEQVVASSEMLPRVGETYTLILAKLPQPSVDVKRFVVGSGEGLGSRENPGHNDMRRLVLILANNSSMRGIGCASPFVAWLIVTL